MDEQVAYDEPSDTEQESRRRRSVPTRRSSARAGWTEVLLNLCKRDHHHHWIDRTLVKSGTCIEALRVVRHRMKQHRANASDLSGRDNAEQRVLEKRGIKTLFLVGNRRPNRPSTITGMGSGMLRLVLAD